MFAYCDSCLSMRNSVCTLNQVHAEEYTHTEMRGRVHYHGWFFSFETKSEWSIHGNGEKTGLRVATRNPPYLLSCRHSFAFRSFLLLVNCFYTQLCTQTCIIIAHVELTCHKLLHAYIQYWWSKKKKKNNRQLIPVIK